MIFVSLKFSTVSWKLCDFLMAPASSYNHSELNKWHAVNFIFIPEILSPKTFAPSEKKKKKNHFKCDRKRIEANAKKNKLYVTRFLFSFIFYFVFNLGFNWLLSLRFGLHTNMESRESFMMNCVLQKLQLHSIVDNNNYTNFDNITSTFNSTSFGNQIVIAAFAAATAADVDNNDSLQTNALDSPLYNRNIYQ